MSPWIDTCFLRAQGSPTHRKQQETWEKHRKRRRDSTSQGPEAALGAVRGKAFDKGITGYLHKVDDDMIHTVTLTVMLVS